MKHTKPQTYLKTYSKAALVGCVLCLNAGCATMSKKDCQVANWEAIGEQDGAHGAMPNYVANHAKACAGIKITPNRVLWEKGRQKGLKNYCTPLNAYVIGRDGRSLSPVCGFLGRTKLMALHETYEDGRRMYRLEKQLDDLRKDYYHYTDYPWYRRK